MPADLDQGRGVCRAPEPAGGTASNGTTATASQFPLASTRATRWRPTTPLMALTPRGPRTERHFTVCVSMIVSRGLGLQPSARRRSGIRSRIMRSNSLNLAQRRNPPWMARQGGMPDGSDCQLPPYPKMRCERLHHGQNWNGILTSWWIILLQPMRHLLHGLSRAYLFQVRRMARPMPLRPHLPPFRPARRFSVFTSGEDNEARQRRAQTGSQRASGPKKDAQAAHRHPSLPAYAPVPHEGTGM